MAVPALQLFSSNQNSYLVGKYTTEVITMAPLKNSFLSSLVLALTFTSFFTALSARHLLQAATPVAQPPPLPPLPKTTLPPLPAPPAQPILPRPTALPPQPSTQIPSLPNPTQTTIPNFPQANFPTVPAIPFTLPSNFPFTLPSNFPFNIPNIPFLSPPPSK